MFRSRQVSVDKADNEQRLTKLWDIYSKNYEQGVANMKAEELPSINQSTFYSLIRYTSRSQSQQSMGKTLRGRPWRPTHYQYWPPCGPLPGVTFIIVTRLQTFNLLYRLLPLVGKYSQVWNGTHNPLSNSHRLIPEFCFCFVFLTHKLSEKTDKFVLVFSHDLLFKKGSFPFRSWSTIWYCV